MREPRLTPRAPSIVALVLVTGIGPFATDAYLAALPALRRSLATSAAVAQLTLTAFIIGLAVGQLVVGPLSDAHGRHRILLAGTSAFTLMSIVCAVAPTGPTLVAARLVQGIAAGSGVAVGRAVVSDTHRGAAAAARYGTLASVTFLGPILAPALGGLIVSHGSWRTVFWALAGLGVVMITTAVFFLPETLPVGRRQAPGWSDTLARMADLIRDRRFIRHVAVQCLATAGFFAYIGGSAFVLQDVYRISPALYSVVFATNAGAMALCSLSFRVLVSRVGPARLRVVGITMSTVAALGLSILALVDRGGQAPFAVPWVLFSVVVGGNGLSIPGTTALAQEAGRRSGGTASALQGGLTFLVGGLMTPLTGVVGYHYLLPLALAMSAFFASALTLLFLTRRGTSPLASRGTDPADPHTDAGDQGD